ncbi:MAG: hypothetical protein KatS3mg081_1043 [Gemmatimonadales bacterium]|nr:MAG: hypothetical protein KatS3mg081_1043 [Gemmatimonadales bacterium]
MKAWAGAGVRVWSVLVDPSGSVKKTLQEPAPAATLIWIAALAAAVSALCLPRQFEILERVLVPVGDPFLDLKSEIMAEGLRRFILADRLLLPPTVVLAAVLLAGAAEPVLALSQNRRPALWAVAFIGLAPVLLQRLGEVAITYWVSSGTGGVADAINLPRQFSTGPDLLWLGGSPPEWIGSLSQRVNLVSLWSVALWSLGLRELEGRGFSAWQLTLPLGVLAVATAITWWLSPIVIPLVLGRP